VPLTDVIFEQANSAVAERGNTGIVSDVLSSGGLSIPFQIGAWYGDTYTVSGTARLSGVGVVGAEITVVVADDTNMANAYLHSIQVTGVGGAWSASIPVGKLCFAYAQNFVGGIHYTAPGAPYVS
jgi:hypothetical protein